MPVGLPVYLPDCSNDCLSVCPLVCLFCCECLSVILYVCLFVCLSSCLSVAFTVCLSSCRAGIGWRMEVCPESHLASQLDIDVIIGADGRRNTLPGHWLAWTNMRVSYTQTRSLDCLCCRFQEKGVPRATGHRHHGQL